MAPIKRSLSLRLRPEKLAVARLEPDAAPPDWALRAKFWTVSRTEGELSVVCPVECVPPGVRVEAPWRCFGIEGIVDFALVGILKALIDPLAAEDIPVFVLSTFDTDYLMVREIYAERAAAALRAAGHKIAE